MPGSFVFSLDTELAWGMFDQRDFPAYRVHFRNTRPRIRRLLSLLERYDVSATWAFVGHLFLRDCGRRRPEGDPHPDVLTPRYSWHRTHWHGMDPGTNREKAPFWYGDDLLAWIRAARPPQEIGCHTFSHIVMDDPAVSRDIARSQVMKCCELARDLDLRLRSFVFPRHSVAHLPVLAECGFTSYRGPEVPRYAGWPELLRRACHFLHRFLALTPPTYRNLRADPHGLVNIPSSMFLMPPDGLRRLIPGRSRVLQAMKGIRRAVETDGVFHLWLHPWNMGSSPVVVDWIEKILRYVSELRSGRGLRVMTMGALAEEVLGHAGPDLRPRGTRPAESGAHQCVGT